MDIYKEVSRIHNNQMAICTITSVNSEEKTVSLFIHGHPGSSIVGMTLSRVKILKPFAHVNGGEVTYLPEVNSIGVVCFVEGVPFVLGFFSPDDPSGKDKNPNSIEMNSGDIVMWQKNNNYIAVRKAGMIEIESTPQLKTYYMPDRNELSVFCENYEFYWNGGAITKTTNDETRETSQTVLIKDKIGPSRIIKIKSGAIGGNKIYRFEMGPPNEFFDVQSPNFIIEISNEGDFLLKVKNNFTASIANNGDASISGKESFSINTDKNISQSAGKNVSISAGESTSLKAAKELLADAEQIIANAKKEGKLGSGASEPMVLGQKLLSALKVLISNYNSHTHRYIDTSDAGPQPSVTQPPMSPASQIQDTVLSKKWKVE